MANILIKQGKEIAGSNLVTPSTKADKVDLSNIIQTGTTSSQAISAGKYFYLNDVLVRAKVDIANGAMFTLNTNYEVVTAGALNELNEKFNYSTSEHIVGEWIDGSKLYEKTINFGTLPNNTSKTVTHNISNLKNIVYVAGIAWRADGVTTPIPTALPANVSYSMELVANTTNIVISTGYNYSAYTTCYVTLRYTKT